MVLVRRIREPFGDTLEERLGSVRDESGEAVVRRVPCKECPARLQEVPVQLWQRDDLAVLDAVLGSAANPGWIGRSCGVYSTASIP